MLPVPALEPRLMLGSLTKPMLNVSGLLMMPVTCVIASLMVPSIVAAFGRLAIGEEPGNSAVFGVV